MSSIQETIAFWKYFVTDLLHFHFHFQPHTVTEACTVPVQGMPGLSKTLEEMMCTILGSFVQEGCVAKIRISNLQIVICGGLCLSKDRFKQLFGKFLNQNFSC